MAFARKYDIAVCHDGPYSEVAYDGYRPVSFLQADGASDVGIEFHSLSKSYNMTGWRIGMAVGNAAMIDALMRVKSNLDSGIPQAIQRMAIAALEGPQDCIDEHNAIYQRRRDRLVEALQGMGLQVQPPKASLYVWAQGAGRLHVGGVRHAPAGRGGRGRDAGHRLRPERRGLRAPLAHHPRRRPGQGAIAPRRVARCKNNRPRDNFT